ncbi:MAG: GGDEF domain-containing protein [Oscillospiraceae bacterium]|nr:GGDEF domain-containing protein [Oscillospiraceae bacterium]
MKFNFSMFTYGAKTLDEYKKVKSEIISDNKIRLNFYSILSALALIICFINSFFDNTALENRYLYLLVAVVMAVISVLTSRPIKMSEKLIDISMYSFMEIYYLASIILATEIHPEEPPISFVVLLFVVPLLFTCVPINTNIMLIVNVILYFILAFQTQTPEMLRFNALDVLIYSFLSIVISTYTMCIKIDRYILMNKNIELSKTDQLTGLPNRRCFELNVEELKKEELEPNLYIFMFDINGLKETNDKYGHGAGDCLIKAAADSIQNIFGPYGTSYRIGGDEFMTIASLPIEPSDVETRLVEETEKYTGLFGEKLSISMGVEKITSIEIIDKTIKEVDVRMYENKRRFYESNGIDRRKP